MPVCIAGANLFRPRSALSPMSSASNKSAKFFVFLRSGKTDDKAVFHHWLLDSFAPWLCREAPALSRFLIDLVDQTPANLPYTPPSEAGSATNLDHVPIYDAILQIWLPTEDDFRAISDPWPQALIDRTTARHRYRATETTIWTRESERPGRKPGLKYLALLDFHDDLSEHAIRRSWAHHTNLARRAHPHAETYLQNWLEESLDVEAPLAKGVSELYLPLECDPFVNFFASPAAREEITHETMHFIRAGRRFYTTEHVLLLDNGARNAAAS